MLALAAPVSLSFGYGFAYGGVPERRPEFLVEFASIDRRGVWSGKSVQTGCLLDSGADETMLNADLALRLGLDILTMPEVPVMGVGGTTMAYRHDVLAELCGRWILIPVLFDPNRDINLLGRAGVFDALRLMFVHSQSLVLAAHHE